MLASPRRQVSGKSDSCCARGGGRLGEFLIFALALVFAPVMWFVMGGPHGIVLVVAVVLLVQSFRYADSQGANIWRGTAFLTGKIAATFLIVWLVFEVLDPYPGSWLDRTFFADRRAFEVDLKIEVDGEPVHIARQIRCAHGRSLATYSFFTSVFHFEGIDSFGKELKSDGAVIVVTPRLCRREAWEELNQNASGNLISPGYIPLIGWMDNAKNPSVTELYFDSEYYTHIDARIKVRSFGVKPISYWQLMDGPDDFAHFTGGRFGNTSLTPVYPEPREYFTAYSLQGIEESQWAEFDVLKVLNRIDRLEVVRLAPVASFAQKIVRPMDIDRIFRGDRSWPPQHESGTPTVPQKGAAAAIVPLRMTSGVLKPSHSETGALVFYPEFSPDKRTRIYEDRCPDVQIGSQRLVCRDIIRLGRNYIYDPQERVLYQLSKLTFAWPLAK